MKEISLIIITGLSGAGKSTAVRAFEDMGFFVVDNLPPALVSKFVELTRQVKGQPYRYALVMDMRGGRFFDQMQEALDYLQQQQVDYRILFLEAADEVLVRRFKETRRRHPLAGGGTVLDGIRRERAKLEELRGRAHRIIDTSSLKPAELKEEIFRAFQPEEEGARLSITVMSFGYKYGIPLDADLVIDVRFLPNPFYIKELRPLTGNDPEVQEYVVSREETKKFLDKFLDLITFLIPEYIKEGKTSLTIAIGCTGGQHRSVTLTNRLAELLADRGDKSYRVEVRHRDIQREKGREI
ncbi:MAG: RNase adapter RapZ [Bacillota bacterium]